MSLPRSQCRRTLASALALVAALVAHTATAAPTPLIPAGVSALADNLPWFYDPTLIYYSQPGCAPIPPGGPEEDPAAAAAVAGAAPGGADAPGDELLPAVIQRTSTYLASTRQLLYVNPARPVGTCNPYRLLSNIESDADAIYFLDNQGPGGIPALWRRLRNANVGDPSTLLQTYPGQPADFSGEIQLWNGVIFFIGHSGFDVMVEYDKLTGQLLNGSVVLATRFALRNMQVDERFLWWINDGALWRNDLTNGNQIVAHAGYIDTYQVEFYDVQQTPEGGVEAFSRLVVARNNQLALLDIQVLPFHLIAPLFVLYTSTDPAARITHIARGQLHYFFFERRPTGPFTREDWLFRLPVFGSATVIHGPVSNAIYTGLRTDGTNLYWVDRLAGSLLQLAENAAAIPVVALRATGLEITQGLQDPAYNVRIVQGRRTFVRLYHKSDGATSVNNVSAVLDVTGTGGYLGRLDPVNRPGKLLTSWRNPSRLVLDDSFLFELPLAWTDQTFLSFTGTVNPNRTLLELDSSNNSASRIALPVSSPRLPLEIITFGFVWNGQIKFGTLGDFNSVNWMRRLYPLAWQGGYGASSPGPGLRWESRFILDDGIIGWLDQSNDDCKKKYQDVKKGIDDRNQCAVDYALNRIRAMRTAGDLPQNRYYYAMVAQDDAAGVPFARGFAPGGDKISGGPSDDVNYMAHEVGHTLGRGHPASGANPVCPNQDASDPGFPNPQARIGSSTTAANDANALLGLDPGDYQASTKMLLPSSTVGDTMSYCSPYWISEYHYEGMYDFMMANPVSAPEQVGAPIAGDWLIVTGGLNLDAGTGAFNELRRTDAVAEIPTLVPGGFRLELRDGGGVLASHDFTPEASPDAQLDVRSFFLVVAFDPGTTQIRVVENGTNRVLATRAVSANAPVVSNVALVNPPDPVTGTVTLGWDAVDDDGDPLRFDVMRPRDGGLSFEPVVLSITTNGVDLDTSAWGGGTSALRVVASDGVLSGVGDGAPFEVENKAPIARILTPADGLRVPWGTLINFSAEVIDPQGQPIPDADVVWSNGYRVLGTGPSISSTDLEVGASPILVQVANAAGLIGSAAITVIVGDDLRFPGPKISATPSSIPFSVAATEIALQSANLDLSNAGGGSLSASLASDQPWLTLDGGAGGTFFAPATISVQIDPTVLPDATTSTASITIANIGDPTDVVVVPVTVAKGAVFTGTPYADSDGDGIEDTLDNCAFASNADQTDTGGLGAGSAPDGVGDACQCGDLNGDGRISIADAVVLQRSLLQPPTATPARPDLCDVGGTAGCSIADAVVIRRALLSPPTAFLAPACVVVPSP